MKKKVISVLATILACFSITSCKDGGIPKGSLALPHFNGVTENGSYDSTYFYRNDLTIFGGDVDVEWVPEDREGGGYFYMYSSGNDGVGMQWEPDESKSVISILRSKDLNDWELCGNVANGFGATIGVDEWIIGQVWAPEVIYNPKDETYYIYVTGMSPSYQDKDGYRDFADTTISAQGKSQYDRFYGAVFMSKNPCGPFELATSERYYGDPAQPNLNGVVITGMTPQIHPKRDCEGLKNDDDYEMEGDKKNTLWGFIDCSPIFAENGDLYLYFTHHMTSYWSGQETWGVKMKDMITPDWDTLTLLAVTDYSTVTYKGDSDPNGHYPRYKLSSYSMEGHKKGDTVYVGDTPLIYGSGTGEGCHMFSHDGRYYLVTTPGGFGGRTYVGVQSVGDSPLGPFERIPGELGYVVGVNETNDYLTGIGHPCYVEKDGEIFSITFAHADPYDGTSAAEDGRIYCFDRISFVENEQFGMLMYGNGPTKSLQPKVISECNNGMKNIAGEATITASNAKNDTIKYLNDGRFVALDYYKSQEFETKGKTTITLTFDTPREIGAIMVYNSYDYDYAFSSVDQIVFSLGETPSWYKDGDLSNVHISNLPFNTDYVNLEQKFMRVGGSALASFNSIKVTEIKITVSQKFKNDSEAIKISDIVVLGR
jgi:hypothetical protein